MAFKLVKLNIEIHDSEIFYHWNYIPEIRGLGGALGTVFPGGSLHGLEYEYLQEIGSGFHELEINEREQSKKGSKTITNADAEILSNVKFELFTDRYGLSVSGGVIYTLVMAFNINTAENILKLLNEMQLQELAKYAESIPNNINGEQALDFGFFNSSGSSVKVPIENLLTLKKYFP